MDSDRRSLARILSQVVDQQQQCVMQFNQISIALESIRSEIRRTDENHHKEVNGLHEIINKLLIQRQQTPPAAPQTPVFDPQIISQQQQMAAYYLRQQQLIQQQYAQHAAGLTSGLPQAPGTPGLSMPKPPVSGIPAGVPSLTQTSLKLPPQPVIGTVNLPISTPPKPEIPKIEQQKEVKKEPTPAPVASTAAAATPVSTIKFDISSHNHQTITTSTTTPAPPSSIFGSATGGIFGQAKAPTSIAKPAVDTPKKEHEEEEEEEDNYEPEVHFAPVIPLPDLVEVKTGEEDETELFKQRCKLYRYTTETKEWKERGTGDIKILKNPKTGGYRVVMRREQVHKLCANFNLSKGMTISKMGKNPKACVWHCHDYSENEATHEQLSAKFASAELTDQFMKFFNEGVNNAATTEATPKKGTEVKKVEETKKEAEKKPEAAFGAQFMKKEGEWDCPGCYARNGAGVNTCLCCGTNKDGTAGTKDPFAKGATIAPTTTATPLSKFTFGLSAGDKKEESGPAAVEKQKFSFSAAAAEAAKEEPSTTTPKVSGLFGAGVSTTSKFSFGGATPTSTGAGLLGSKPQFSFGVKKEDPSSTTPAGAASPVNFSFKPAPTTPTPGKSIFGTSTEKKEETQSATASVTSATNKIFGSGSNIGTSGFSFGSLTKTGGGLFDEEAKKKAQEDLAKQKQSKFGVALKKEEPKASAAAADGDDEDDHGGEDEYEPEVDFAPVIPLPDLVEVKTGEEEETVLFKERCKLYRYAADTKEWKERGTGDIKVLKNPSGACRVVMRREQIHKLCANFNLTKGMTISKMGKNNKACLWYCQDYSETDPTHEQLSAKFGSPEQADNFMKVFSEATA